MNDFPETSLQRDLERADWLAKRAGSHMWTDLQRNAWRAACLEIFTSCYHEGEEAARQEIKERLGLT
jgi:hypothetical protein